MTHTDLTLDLLEAGTLLIDAVHSVDEIADELITLFEGWQREGASDASLEWLGSVITRLGFLNGRFASTALALSHEREAGNGG